MDDGSEPLLKEPELAPNTDGDLPIQNQESAEQLWAARGIEDVFFQREAQVTWWTVLGGIAVAALLTQLEGMLTSFKAGQWYIILYFLATCFVIINSWVQTAWGSLVLKWPISVDSAIIQFFLGLSTSVAALTITQPALWFGAISITVFFAQINQWFFMKRRSWIGIPQEIIAGFRQGRIIYAGFFLLCLAGCLHLSLQPQPWVQIAWGILAVLATIYSLLMQHSGMQAEKRRMGIA